MSLALLSLALTAFAIGMTEFVVVGMLPILAENFSVSIATAGFLVTAYALAVMVAAPLVTAITMRIPRKRLMLGLIGLFILGNTIAAIAPTYAILLLGRILSGVAHGVFFAISVKVAIQLVEKEKQASAIALMFSGLTVALVLGVPLGTFLAETVTWRSSFWVIVISGILSFLGVQQWIPQNLHWKIPHSFRQQFSFLRHKSMLYSYALTIVSFGGPFIAYTYISEILHTVTGFSFNWISVILVLYGLSVMAGNYLGGRFSDKFGVFKTLKMNIVLLTVILLIFYFTQVSSLYSVITIVFWGALAFGIVPSLQFLIMKLVAHYDVQAEEVASGTNIAAFNLGIAGGSFVGGIVVNSGALTATPLIAAIVVALSYLLIHTIAKSHECQTSIREHTNIPKGPTCQ
jgi:predicted MFS family arabinose efflux permease